MTSAPARPASEDIAERVLWLLAHWREDTAYISSGTQIPNHPAYRQPRRRRRIHLPSLVAVETDRLCSTMDGRDASTHFSFSTAIRV